MQFWRFCLMLTTSTHLAACSVNAGRGAPATPLDPRDRVLVASLDSFFQVRVSMDSLSGVVLLARDGVPIYTRTTGLANRATGETNRVDTRFNLASVDKFFTRIAIRQLQQAGKLSMSDRVGVHLPDYPNQRVRDDVTIEHLYTMRSGMGDFGSDDLRTYTARLSTLRSLDDFIALFAEDSLLFAPGSRQSYSNASYVVLGKIVERASGLSYYDYVQRRIFDAAGMSNTGYFTPDERGAGTAVPYTTSPAAIGSPSGGGTQLPQRVSAASLLPYRGSSAGGGFSTAEDLLRLSRAILSHRLLDAAFTDSLLDLRPAPFSFDGWSGGWAGGWAGGSQGINTQFYIQSTGHTLIVLSNYDPPSATVFRNRFWGDWIRTWLESAPPNG